MMLQRDGVNGVNVSIKFANVPARACCIQRCKFSSTSYGNIELQE
jgi:hypothetical protein